MGAQPQRRSPGLPPLAILAIGIFAASTSSIFIRFAQVEVPSIIIASYRLALAALILLPIAISRHWANIRNLEKRQWIQIVAAGLFLGAHFGTWITSLEYTSVASSVVLVQTTPIFVLLLSPLFLGERSSRWTYIGLALAITGSALIAMSDTCGVSLDRNCLTDITDLNAGTLRGDFLALAGAVSGAAYLMIGRTTRQSMPLVPYITLIYAIAAISLIGVAAASGSPFTGYSPEMYLWFLLLALFPQLLAHSSYNWALKYLPATSVSLSLLGEPVSAAFLAYVILEEHIPGVRWLGALIVLLGIATALYRPRKTLHGTSKVDKIAR